MSHVLRWAAIFLCIMSQADGAPRPEVVRVISAETKNGRNHGSYGSGVLVETEIVFTAWHVIRENPNEVEIRFFDGRLVPGEFIAADNDWDIAIIRVQPTHGIKPALIAAMDPKPRELLTIAGYGGPEPNYREDTGPVTMYLSPKGLGIDQLVELRATARDGDSGGPIFNQRGQVAGVLFGSSDGLTSGACASRLREFMNRKSVKWKIGK